MIDPLKTQYSITKLITDLGVRGSVVRTDGTSFPVHAVVASAAQVNPEPSFPSTTYGDVKVAYVTVNGKKKPVIGDSLKVEKETFRVMKVDEYKLKTTVIAFKLEIQA